MDEIFDLLRRSKRASQLASDLEGRLPFTYLGIVTRNDDPLGKRRVKCTLQHTGGKTETDWLYRVTNSHSDDPQVPKPGMTIEVRFIDGDPHKGVYSGVLTNLPNPERATENPIADDARKIEGDRIFEVGRDDTLTVERTITIQNKAGASITLNPDGTIDINAPAGVRIVCQQESTINGKAIAVIGAMDGDTESNGPDAIVSSGQL